MLSHVCTIAVVLLTFHLTQARSPEPAPVLKLVDGSVSADGHVKIEWKRLKQGSRVELQQSESENFNGAKTIYSGPDNATFVSGLDNGTYYYRIREAGGEWSAPAMLTVKHHSLRLALVLFSLGALVFGLTVFIVVKGALHASVD
jgi:hypothetical protein